VLINELYLLYFAPVESSSARSISWSTLFYKREHYRPGEDTSKNDNAHHRIGLLLAYSFTSHQYTSSTNRRCWRS